MHWNMALGLVFLCRKPTLNYHTEALSQTSLIGESRRPARRERWPEARGSRETTPGPFSHVAHAGTGTRDWNGRAVRCLVGSIDAATARRRRRRATGTCARRGVGTRRGVETGRRRSRERHSTGSKTIRKLAGARDAPPCAHAKPPSLESQLGHIWRLRITTGTPENEGEGALVSASIYGSYPNVPIRIVFREEK